MPAESIEDVLDRLDAIILRSRREHSRVGYFAALYRNVTVCVQRGVAAGRFTDAARMARLDVVFANRYLDAEESYRSARPLSRCWRVAFDAARTWPPVVLQHLLLGMHAHITLDLGVAAAEVAPGRALPGLRQDFLEINRLLAEMIDEVQQRMTVVSPWMGILDRFGQRRDEELCGFGLTRARDFAWGVAVRLAPMDATSRAREIESVDALATTLAIPIHSPGRRARAALLGVRMGEETDVARVIDALDGRRRRA